MGRNQNDSKSGRAIAVGLIMVGATAKTIENDPSWFSVDIGKDKGMNIGIDGQFIYRNFTGIFAPLAFATVSFIR